jgi:phage gpG-like protein
MWRYDATVDPSDTVANLAGMSGRAENMRPVFTVIRDLMLGDQRRNFEGRGSVFGSWPALAPGTLARKGGSSQPLVLTGALQKAATGSTGKVTRITKGGVTVGINQRIYYARFHQAGAKAGSRKGDLPKRELVGITRSTREKSLTLIQKYLVGL